MTPMQETPDHFNQPLLRHAEFVKPSLAIKMKVGHGGLAEDILNKAQALLENNTVDFQPLGDMYLATLMRGIEAARRQDGDTESRITAMLYPAMQLKANGGMFRYPLVTRIANRLVQFLEVIAVPDAGAVEIVIAFHTTLRAVIMGKVSGDGGKHGNELAQALEAACTRYFEHYPANRAEREQQTAEF